MKHFLCTLLFLGLGLTISAQKSHYKVENFIGGNLCPSEPWKLVFYDEFNGQQLDRTKWYSYYPYAAGNTDTCVFCRRHEESNSQQIYKDENVVVSNGTLKLAIKKEPATWMGANTQFTSGVINSVLSFSNYAKYEIRCKLPGGKGFWPAFWVFGGGTEIDIFETGGHEPNTIHSVVHRWMSNGARLNNGSFEFTGNNFMNEFHTFAVEYDPYYIKFLVDGFPVNIRSRFHDILGRPVSVCELLPNTYLRDTLYPQPTNPVQVIANVAVSINGGPFTDAPDNSTIFPNQMEIDWIRVYQRNPQAGLSDICSTRKVEGNSTICLGQTQSYEFTGAEIDSVSWMIDSTKLRVVNRTASTITVTTLNPFVSGETWIKTISNPLTPCPQNIFIKKIWIGSPSINITVNNREICPVFLTAQVQPNDMIGNWNLNGSRITTEIADNQAFIYGSKTTTANYNYSFTAVNGCGTSSRTGSGNIAKCPRQLRSKEIDDKLNVLNIAPNPTDKNLNIELDKSISADKIDFVQIIDALGRTHETLKLEGNSIQLNTVNYLNGMYVIILKLLNSDNVIMQKFFIEH